MKNILTAAFLMLIVFAGTSCRKAKLYDPTIATVEPLNGSWKVSSFVTDDQSTTGQWQEYQLICSSNGSMSIKNSVVTFNCAWYWSDEYHTSCHFTVLNAGDNTLIKSMQDDWDLTSHDGKTCHFTSRNPNHHIEMVWTKQ